jgi:tartrate-resistant acid phosphatase type 5
MNAYSSEEKAEMKQSRKSHKALGRRLVLLSCLIGSYEPNGLKAQEPPPPPPISEALVHRLPSAYQDEARRVITAPDAFQNFYNHATDEEWRGLAFDAMAGKQEGLEFLRAQLDKEPSGITRAQLFIALEKYFARHPQDQAVLEKHVSSDPDPTAALAALETLRRVRESGLGELLKNRVQAASNDDSDNIRKQLRDAYLAHYMWYGDVRLPEFAYAPPPLFRVKPSGQLVRVLAFGDFAWGSGDAQSKTAAAMRAYHQQHPFDFGITLGDNFYGRGPFFFAERTGLSSPYDPRWQTEWEQLYSPMGIKFYPSFGNADYIDVNGPAAELAYTKKSQSWVFPAPYYTYTAGSVQFFAIDNIRLSDDELHWLDEQLAKSKARWKVVYGHYHIYSATDGKNDELVSRLLPVLKENSVDVWLNGHMHDMQELQPEGSLHFFISGGGGAELSGNAPTYKGANFRESRHGFSVIEADEQHFDVIFVSDSGEELHRSHIIK